MQAIPCISHSKPGYTEGSSQKIKYGILAIMAAPQRCWLKSSLTYNDVILAKAKIRSIESFTPAVENI